MMLRASRNRTSSKLIAVSQREDLPLGSATERASIQVAAVLGLWPSQGHLAGRDLDPYLGI